MKKDHMPASPPAGGLMEAVVLLGHGSRIPGAGNSMFDVARGLKEKYGHALVEVCYLSRLGPHFDEVFEKCVDRGVNRIIVIPYFLHDGLHIKLDIPEMLQEEAAKQPHVELVLGNRLGFDPALIDVVEKRIDESQWFCDVREIQLPPRKCFPVPPGQHEFVEMPPEMARKWKEEHEKKQKGDRDA